MIFGVSTFETAFDSALSSDIYLGYSIDLIMSRVPKIIYNIDNLTKAIPIKTYSMSCRMGVPTPSYLADAIIALDKDDPRLSDSFVNVLMWTYANEWRLAVQTIENMKYRMKLDFASTEDLDEQWGIMLGLRRKSGESDDSYRTRLATHIRIITSSGTKANCELIIDRITGAPNGSNLETFGNGTVVLNWTSPDAIIAAIPKATLISDAMDRMLAAGISWSTSYPLISYYSDVLIDGNVILPYEMNGAISKQRGIQYRMSFGNWNKTLKTYNARAYLYDKGYISYNSNFRLIKEILKLYNMNGKITLFTEMDRDVTYYIDSLNSKNMNRSYMIGGIVEVA